jgi:LmbE family N-acetylglucosaminyl deacetylase
MLPEVLEEWRCLRPVVVAAHPDDEVIGAGATLARFPGAIVIHATDGAPRSRARWQNFAADRRREAEAALALAGVAANRIVCLGYPDGEAQFALAALAKDLRQVLAGLRPDVVITHPYEGVHPDHDATAFAVRAACRMLGRSAPLLAEMTSYHLIDGRFITGEFLPHPDAGEIVEHRLDASEQEVKRRMYGLFRTQGNLLATFPVAHERFRRAPCYDFRAPPHDGLLGYDHADWRSLAASAAREFHL